MSERVRDATYSFHSSKISPVQLARLGYQIPHGRYRATPAPLTAAMELQVTTIILLWCCSWLLVNAHNCQHQHPKAHEVSLFNTL